MKKTYIRKPGSDFAWSSIQPYLTPARSAVYGVVAQHQGKYGGGMTGGEITALMLDLPGANKTNPSYHRRAEELVQQGALREGPLRVCSVSGMDSCKTYCIVHDPETVVPFVAEEPKNPEGPKVEGVASRKLAAARAEVSERIEQFSGYGSAGVDARSVVAMLKLVAEKLA